MLLKSTARFGKIDCLTNTRVQNIKTTPPRGSNNFRPEFSRFLSSGTIRHVRNVLVLFFHIMGSGGHGPIHKAHHQL